MMMLQPGAAEPLLAQLEDCSGLSVPLKQLWSLVWQASFGSLDLVAALCPDP